MRRVFGRLVFLAALTAAPLWAQERTAAGEEILVTGERDRREAVHDFVESVTVATDDQIARFEAPICPASFGLPPGHNEVVAERIRLIAEHVGIGAQGGECLPNVVVLVTEDGGDLIRVLRRARPDLFGVLELSQIRDIAQLQGPVRAWQLTELRGADGRPVQWIEIGKERRIRPALTGVMPSRTQRPTRQDFSVSIVVFDLDSLDGLTLLQIADHAAMRALARTEPAAMPARRSILSLFADRLAGSVPADELTGWDAAYLSALYSTGNTVSAHQQRASLARTMRRELSETERQ